MTRTFRGLGPRHLQVYFDEFCYRLNQTFDQQPIFEKLSQLCTSVKATTYPNLIKRVYPSQEETGGHYTNNMDGYVPWFFTKEKKRWFVGVWSLATTGIRAPTEQLSVKRTWFGWAGSGVTSCTSSDGPNPVFVS